LSLIKFECEPGLENVGDFEKNEPKEEETFIFDLSDFPCISKLKEFSSTEKY
jgi:hypothetical protein